MLHMNRNHWVSILLVCIMVLAFWLRLDVMASEGFDAMEAHSIATANDLVSYPFFATSSIIYDLVLNKHLPLDFLFRGLFGVFFGFSIIAQRLYSLFFGMLTIFVMFKLGSVLGNRWTGLIAAFFLAIHSNHILYSVDLRMYALLIFLSSLNLYLFVSHRKGDDDVGWVIIFVNAALIYTHFVSILLVFGELLILFVVWLDAQKKDTLSRLNLIHTMKQMKDLATSLLLAAPGIFSILLFLPQNAQSMDWFPKPSLALIKEMIVLVSFGSVDFIQRYFLYFLLVLVAVYLIGRYSINNRFYLYSFLGIVVFTLLSIIIISYLFTPILEARLILFIIPVIYVMVALAITSVSKKAYILLGIVIFVLLLLQPTNNLIYRERSEHIDDFVAAVEMQQDKPDAFLTMFGGNSYHINYYYEMIPSYIVPVRWNSDIDENGDALKRFIDDKELVWFYVSNHDVNEFQKEAVLKQLEQSYDLITVTPFTHVILYVFETK